MGIFAKAGAVVRIGEGEVHTSVVHVDDAARAYVCALDKACVRPGETKKIYNVTDTSDVTFREFTDAMASVLGLPVRAMDIPEAVKFAGPLAGGFFSQRIRGKGDRARNELGWKPTEIGVIEDIRNGSYVEVAKEIVAS
ncbi:hypothetical protein NPX13_g8013 [Xylaria arbuscula]|uniref:NAD-dependent epimerase/dehydratase domain-containing protein n=1 Tax=Xylaria arbuscula TaxID=114810 RepID=A0A9W8TKK6_9PEZI|nr:hypothetical protein NPX13_g8013 [Xylaria arbuscula]